VESTHPAEALLKASESADLLAVGSRGLTPLAAVLLGSTAEKLGARCPNPLLVYREAGTRRGLFSSLLGAS
jgi:nucleotide-binding universal stress UspA family protein